MSRSFGREHLVAFGNFILNAKGVKDEVSAEDIAAFDLLNSNIQPETTAAPSGESTDAGETKGTVSEPA
jgi:hypothetical protein